MFATKRENTVFVLWFFGLLAMIWGGTEVAMNSHNLVHSDALVMLSFLLPLGYCWVSSLLVPWTREGWPCSQRMFLGLLTGGLAFIWLLIGLTTGWH